MTIRESVYFSIAHGDLLHDPNSETGADRIGALARADKLGAALWHVTGSHDVSSFREAIVLLADRIEGHSCHTREMLDVCRRAIEEWLACTCVECEGRKFVTSPTGVRSTCKDCGGTGRGEASAGERIRAMRISRRDYARLSTVFQSARALLNAADARVSRQVAYQLGHSNQQVAK